MRILLLAVLPFLALAACGYGAGPAPFSYGPSLGPQPSDSLPPGADPTPKGARG